MKKLPSFTIPAIRVVVITNPANAYLSPGIALLVESAFGGTQEEFASVQDFIAWWTKETQDQIKFALEV